MKKNPLPLWCSILAASSCCFNACIKPGPIIIPPAHQLARITQLNTLSDYPDSFKITYNHKGNPDKMVPANVSTGSPQYLFRYNNQHQLIAKIGAYSSEMQGFANARLYVYDHTNRVVRDTAYSLGFYNSSGEPVIKSGERLRVTSYTYDNKNRIIKTVELSLPVYYNRIRITREYFYNTTGNIWKIHQVYEDITIPEPDCYPHCVPAQVRDIYPVYDNKVNFRSLHPVWQFVDRDYSRNNAFTALSYNKYDLPVEFKLGEDQLEQTVLGVYCPHAIIRYQYLW